MEQVKTNNTTISVIVPIYNGEKYLAECIESILDQTFNDFELLLIDDGSSDRSGEICDEYAKTDSRIRVIHKNNEGANASRRAGVLAAKGEWIAFCDADDTMPVFALEHLYSLHNDTDVVIGFHEEHIQNKVLNLKECRQSSITANHFPPSPWAKIFRKEILNEKMFDFPSEIRFGEDMIMNIRIMFYIKKAPHILYEKVYNYRRNIVGVSHTKKASLDYEYAFDKAREQSIPVELLGDYMKEIIWSRINGLTSIAYNNPELIALWEHEYLKRLYKDIKHYNYKRNLREYIITEIRNRHVIKLTAFIRLACCSLSYRLKLNN